MKEHSGFRFGRSFRIRLLSAFGLLTAVGIACLVGAGSRDTAEAAYFSTDNLTPSAADTPEADSEADTYAQTPVTSFRISNLTPQVESELDFVDWFYCPWEDSRYIFLPAASDRSNLVLTYEAGGETVYLNDSAVISGAATNLLSTADVFTLKVGSTAYGEVHVMQSNLGCVFISTSHGGLTYLDKHKFYTETGTTLILDEAGTVQYNGEMEKLKSHGNSSWDYAEFADHTTQKRPYNLKLPAKANLFGMGKAKKWTLLSNFLDHSELRNAVSFAMAENAGIPYTPDYVFVDLYSDGEYRGTYQFCERVQIQKNRVNITDLEEETEALNDKDLSEYDHIAVGAGLNEYLENSYKYYDIPNDPADITGGYLVQFQLYNRYPGDTESGFVTSRGQAVDLKSPEYASKAQVEYIRTFMQDLEDAIYSETGYNSKGKHYSDYIDVDSLILLYLIEEITMDSDGPQASFYFYKEADSKGDGKLHCGPAWDFDLAYYNFGKSVLSGDGTRVFSNQTDSIFAATFPIHGYDDNLTDDQGSGNANTSGYGWITMLYRREDFVKRAAELYYECYDHYLLELTDTTQENGALITQMGETIQPSAEMNNIVTHMYGKEYRRLGPNNGENFTECVDYIRSFTERRRNGLRAIWLEPFAEVRTEELQSFYEAIEQERYDEAEQKALQEILEDAVQAMDDAADMDEVQAIYEEAASALANVPRALLLGDCNDDLTVNVLDAQTLLMNYAKRLAGMSETFDTTQLRNADVDGNGTQDAVDAMHILRYAAAKLSDIPYTFPAEE